MDNDFTKKLGGWLNTPKEERDYAVGALYLLQLSGNKIMYANIMANLPRRHDFIEFQLQKYYDFRVRKLTHDEVETMQKEVDAIVEKDLPTTLALDEAPTHKGRRDDHEQLPEEIQALYTENLTLLHRMRELHLRLRTLSLENATCPDSERYPFLKEIIGLDKKMHSNWERYDHFVVEEKPKTKTTRKKTEKA